MSVIGEHLLVHTADVLRPASTEAGPGRWRRDDVPHLLAQPCRFNPATVDEREAVAQERGYARHVVYFPPGVDVQRDDVLQDVRLRATGAPSEFEGAYRVMARTPPSLPHHLRAEAEEIQLPEAE